MNRRFIVLLVLVLNLVGCTKNHRDDYATVVKDLDVVDMVTRSSTTSIVRDVYEDDKELLFTCGYDTTGVVLYDGCYFVESKYRITPELMLKAKEQGVEATSSCAEINQKLSGHYQKIYFDVVGSGVFVDRYMDLAVDLWNNIGDCSLSFQTDDIIASIGEDKYLYEIDVVLSPNSIPRDVFTSFTPMLDVYDKKPPYARIDINTSHEKWSIVSNNTFGQRDLLMAHIIAEAVGFSEDTTDITSGSIMLSEDLLSDEIMQLWVGITEKDKIAIRNEYPKSTLDKQYQFDWKPSLFGEGCNTLFVNQDYTLTINNILGCCTQNATRYVEIYKGTTRISRNTYNSNPIQLKLNFSDVATYTIKVIVTEEPLMQVIHEYAFDVHAMKYVLVVEQPDQVQLNVPYNINFDYKHPLHPNAVIDYRIKEVMFDGGAGYSAVLDAISDTEKELTLHKNGCYFLDVVVKDGEDILDSWCCNYTVLNDLSDGLQMKYLGTTQNEGSEQVNIFNYLVTQNDIPLGERVAYLFEYEFEHRTWGNPNLRRVNRVWDLDYNILGFTNNSSNMISLLYYRDVASTQWYQEFIYQYYTGFVYCPTNGVRMVERDNILDLPMRSCGRLNIENYSNPPRISRPTLNLVE